MSQTLDLNDPIAVLLAVHRALSRAGIEAATYGGLALAVYGEPRETRDADLAVFGVSGAEAHRALDEAGLQAVLAFDRVGFGGNLVTRLTLLGGASATGLNVADLVEPRSPRYARAALDRGMLGELRGHPIRVLTPEDFVLFKVLSTRERDLEDAAAVLRSLGDRIDVSEIDREAERLAAEITGHDVAGRWRRTQELRGA